MLLQPKKYNMALITNLVSAWKMDEESGNLVDSHGTNTGTDNGTTVVAGKINNGRTFDGTNDYVDIGGDSSLHTANAGLSFWIKSTNDARGIIFEQGDDDAVTFVSIEVGAGSTGFLTDELITIVTNSSGGTENRIGYTTATRSELFDGNWHHIVFVADTSEYRLYLDGVEKTLTVGVGNNNGAWTDKAGLDVGGIGAGIGNSVDWFAKFNGTLDELYYFNEALNDRDVTNLYNLGAGLPYPFHPIAFDNTAESTAYSFSYTCTGKDRALVVGIFNAQVNETNITGVTYDGVSLTKVITEQNTYGMYLFVLLNPASGSNTLVINKTVASDNVAFVTSYTGVGNIDAVASDKTSAGTTDLALDTAVRNSNAWLVNLGTHVCTDAGVDIVTEYTERQNAQLIAANIQASLGDSDGTVATGNVETNFSSATTRPTSIVAGLTVSLTPPTGNFLQSF